MINRREVIASGAGASLLAGAAAAGVVEASWGEKHFRGSIGGDAPMRTLPGAAVFIADPQSAAAQAAARGATASGARVRFLNTDITALYESLDLAWRAAPFSIAGLTSPTTLFVLERLAWDRGLRAAYRGEHRLSSGRPEHIVKDFPALLDRMHNAGREWAEELGNLLSEGSRTAFVAAEEACGSFALFGSSDETLASWLLVPSRLPRRTRRPRGLVDAHHGDTEWQYSPRT